MGAHPSYRQVVGAAGERLAARWYEGAGYEVLDRNWRTAAGEIDLVCRRGPVLVVCEVKVRRTDRFGDGAGAVTLAKQQRLRRLAAAWVAAHPVAWGEVRFDVVAVGRHGLEVIEAAF